MKCFTKFWHPPMDPGTKHMFLELLSPFLNNSRQCPVETLFELYRSILFLEYEAAITILSFITLLVWCFSNVKSKKHKVAESCSVPFMTLLLFKYIVLFYTAMFSASRSSMVLPFGRVHIWPRLVWLFLDMISGCGFFSVFYRYDIVFEYNGLQILGSMVLPYMAILEFYVLDANKQVLYQALNSSTISRIRIYSQCFLLIYTTYLFLTQWRKKGPNSSRLFLLDGCWAFLEDIRNHYFAEINKDKSNA